MRTESAKDPYTQVQLHICWYLILHGGSDLLIVYVMRKRYIPEMNAQYTTAWFKENYKEHLSTHCSGYVNILGRTKEHTVKYKTRIGEREDLYQPPCQQHNLEPCPCERTMVAEDGFTVATI